MLFVHLEELGCGEWDLECKQLDLMSVQSVDGIFALKHRNNCAFRLFRRTWMWSNGIMTNNHTTRFRATSISAECPLLHTETEVSSIDGANGFFYHRTRE